MSSSVLYMSMSLDGFIAGPDDDAGQGLGSGGERRHDWLGDGGNGVSGFRPSGPSGEIFDELRSPRSPDLRANPGEAARAGV
jgi:hypothetical protein